MILPVAINHPLTEVEIYSRFSREFICIFFIKYAAQRITNRTRMMRVSFIEKKLYIYYFCRGLSGVACENTLPREVASAMAALIIVQFGTYPGWAFTLLMRFVFGVVLGLKPPLVTFILKP